MDRRGFVAVLVLIAAMLAGCTGTIVIGDYGSVSGTVLFADSKVPVMNARVTVGGKSDYTDRSGRFHIKNVESGWQELWIRHEEFRSSHKVDVRIPVGGNQELDNILVERRPYQPQTGNVAGFVYIRKGSQLGAAALGEETLFSAQWAVPRDYEPLSNALVQVSGNSARTDSDGKFFISGLAARSHTLTVTHPSLRFPIEKTVRIYAGETTWLDEYDQDALYGGIGYYIAIGIGNYPKLGKTIPGSEQNAERVYQTLFGGNMLAGLGKRLIGPDATKAKIKQAILEANDKAGSAADYLVIYFSGISGQDYLSPVDSNGRDWSTEIKDSELELWVRGFPGNVTLIVDGSDSATMADGHVFPLALRRPQYTVLSAAGDGEQVYYEQRLGSSVFTYYLIEGIDSRAADKNFDGDITTGELYDYINAEMRDYFRRRNVPEVDRHYPYIYEGGSYGSSVIFRY